MRSLSHFATITAAVVAFGLPALPGSVFAQQVQSRLFDVTKAKLRVCMYPLYFAISFRDPKTNELKGLDIELAGELAKELGAQLEFDSMDIS
jgi:ABC-type amino acid transport substrate-binding protein